MGIAKDHMQLKNLLEESIKSIRKVDKIIENDLEEHFQTWIPLTNNIVKYKEGIHFPLINQLFKIIKENENLVNQMKLRKQQYITDARKHNNDKLDDLSEEFEDMDDA